jgi:dephospho-CoA kinase
MLNVGLTGNVAAGKSTVMAWFAAWGATVIDADLLAHEAQQPGTATLGAIARRFGDGMVRADGTLDREALRARVMGDDDALAALNAIVHPAVRRRRADLAAEAARRGDCVLVNDIPLLFEVLDPADFDLVVLVDAPEAVRRERLVQLRGLAPDAADRMIAAQIPSHRKRARSAIVLDNDGSLDALQANAREAWRHIRRRAAVKDCGPVSGPLLAIVSHAGDETALCGGSLARYADAGVSVHVACAGPRLDPRLHDAARLLGVAAVHALPPDGPAVGPIPESAPAVVIVADRDAANDDAAGGELRNLSARLARDGATVYRVMPDARDETIPVRVDVRPWRDVVRAAWACYGADPSGGMESGRWLARERETFHVDGAVAAPATDLFQGAARPVDSPMDDG